MRLHVFAMITSWAILPVAAQDLRPAQISNLQSGNILVDPKGMTLYTFDKDTPGKSACAGDCAAAWPPLMAADGAVPQENWSVIPRPDGSAQWAYKSKPLYTWIKDKQPGDVSGDGFKSVWHVAKP